MRRIPYKGSSQQSLIILILIVLIIIAISVNLTLAWFYGRATNSRVELTGNVMFTTDKTGIINGEALNFTEEERYPGNIVKRTLRIQKDSEQQSFYLRMRAEVRIDGLRTNAITFKISEEDDLYWIPQTSGNITWYYCYSDFDTWDLLSGSANMNELVHFEFEISPTLSQDRIDRVITIILYVEAVSIDDGYDHWQYLPPNWPYDPEN